MGNRKIAKKLIQLSGVLAAALALTSCNKGTNTATGTASPMSGMAPSPASFTPRVGIGVSTAARTCIAIHNGDLKTGDTISLVSPIAPVTFFSATISGVANQACPITNNVDTTVSNYDVTPQTTIPKLTPMIAVVGSPPFLVNKNNVAQSDIDQDGKAETFRACSADNGVHLTVWNGDPLTGTLLWHGYYYEASNPGIGPVCTPAEMPAT